MQKAVLFDLDGTLLPMDMEVFLSQYFKAASRILPGRDPREVMGALAESSGVVIASDGPDETNAQVYKREFERRLRMDWEDIERHFERFYTTEFAALSRHFPADARAARAVHLARERGHLCLLATNPLFPRVATHERMRWAGLSLEWFDEVTTYEDCTAAKPSLNYYRERMTKHGLSPERCLMVGNSPKEDLVPAHALGMATFFLNVTPEPYGGEKVWDAEGGFDELLVYLKTW